MEEVAYIILGWFLGILSPLIIKKISEKTERDSLEKIIFNDLKELKKRLAPLPYLVNPKYGKLDKVTFEWLKINSGINFSEVLEKISKEGNDEVQVLSYINTKGQQNKTATNFKKMHLFVIDSHLMNIGLVDTGLMEKILEIRFHVEAFNEEVDSLREHLRLTFLPGITENNHKIVSQEIENRSLIISKKSIYIVEKINDILKSTDA